MMTGPRRIGEEASGYIARRGDVDAVAASRIMTAWAELVGEEIGRRTEGGRFKAGELLIYVESPAWANELQLMGEAFRERLNAQTGEETVKSIRFTVSRQVGRRNSRKEDEERAEDRYRPRPGRDLALTEEQRREIENVAAGVTDEGVRNALKRAMETSLRLRAKNGQNPR